MTKLQSLYCHAKVSYYMQNSNRTSGSHRMEDEIWSILTDRGLTISVAESCTGGLIGNLITDVPGSSRYFLGGIIVYCNQSKMEILNVSPKTIAEYGAVSDQTVREMAGNVKRVFKLIWVLRSQALPDQTAEAGKNPSGLYSLGWRWMIKSSRPDITSMAQGEISSKRPRTWPLTI
jgi:PncC family amidohydrolase